MDKISLSSGKVVLSEIGKVMCFMSALYRMDMRKQRLFI